MKFGKIDKQPVNRVKSVVYAEHLTDTEKLALRDLKSALNKLLGDRLEDMILFGSKARGDFSVDSDMDVAILVRELNRELKDEILNIVADIEVEYLTPLSTLVLSTEEFNRLRARERRIALDIEEEGIPL